MLLVIFKKNLVFSRGLVVVNKKRLLMGLEFFCLLIVGSNVVCNSVDPSTNYVYPATELSTVIDNFHGIEVVDHYRWLENQQAEKTVAWVGLQNDLTAKFLAECPARAKIRERLTRLWNYKKYSAPTKYGDYYFFWKNDGLQNQYVLYRVRDLTDAPILVIDPNKLSVDGTVAIEDTCITKDGSLLAYSISTHGSDWKEIKILNIETGVMYSEILKWCKFTNFTWKNDNSGLYYNRFSQDDGYAEGVYWHALGTDQSQDLLIYKDQKKECVAAPCITDDGCYLLLVTSEGAGEKNSVAFRPINSQDSFTPIFDSFDFKYTFVGNIGSEFYFLTDNEAPQGRVIAIDVVNDVKCWRVVLPQSKDILSAASIVHNKLICHFMQDAQSSLRIYALDGAYVSNIALPTAGSASYSYSSQKSSEIFITFTSFLYPTTIFRYSFEDLAFTQVWSVGVDFDPSLYETKQIFYQSADGTKVPMFITHKKGLNLNKNNPTLLYGYGGFNVSITPFFSLGVTNWLEQGGVFAIANIRGGDEYGSAWHEAAILGKRQNAFDDFIAAGEWLVANSYTNPSKLAISGGSNGGLLVGVCMQQRPDLFGAVISQVPVTDMLRFHKFTAGCYWVSEYGDVNKPEDFKAMYAYSPLHTVQEGVKYPPLLVTSADTDDRVVPLHSKKWVARLQAASGGNNLILLRYETKAGHGGGMPTTKQIEDVTDRYAFLFKVFNMEFKNT